MLGSPFLQINFIQKANKIFLELREREREGALAKGITQWLSTTGDFTLRTHMTMYADILCIHFISKDK